MTEVGETDESDQRDVGSDSSAAASEVNGAPTGGRPMISQRTALSCAIFVAIAAYVGGAEVAYSDSQKAQLGLVMWAAFQCSTYAELSKNQDEKVRLSQVGHRAGTEFIEAIEKNEISEDEIRSNVPMGVTLRFGGPSADFIIGRVFEGAVNAALDSVIKEDSAGMPLKIEDWIMDDERQAIKAQTKYRNSNCELIR